MFGRLIQKELLNHLLDFRFVATFALCALLSVLSVHVGTRNYARQVQEYAAVAEMNRRTTRDYLNQGDSRSIALKGYGWNLRPEALSPVVYGLSGVLGREVSIHYDQPLLFGASVFETDPVHTLFGVLDLAFIVKIVMSLIVLMFTYDAICGEKEGGTLRLYCSFPVPRSHLALAKLGGSAMAALIPVAFAFLLSSVYLALSTAVELRGEDWVRIAVLTGLMAAYLTVFAAFGLLFSALTHRRMTAFLGLLGLWTLWIFVVPNLSVRIARGLAPVESIYRIQREGEVVRSEMERERRDEIQGFQKGLPGGNFASLPEVRRQEIQMRLQEIMVRWDTDLNTRLTQMHAKRRNQMHHQYGLAAALSVISPLSAITVASMDLARTGYIQQEEVEDALNVYRLELARFFQGQRDRDAFPWFSYQNQETLGRCLARNVFPILDLALLAILGFAGAYVAILRYDVR